MGQSPPVQIVYPASCVKWGVPWGEDVQGLQLLRVQIQCFAHHLREHHIDLLWFPPTRGGLPHRNRGGNNDDAFSSSGLKVLTSVLSSARDGCVYLLEGRVGGRQNDGGGCEQARLQLQREDVYADACCSCGLGLPRKTNEDES